MAQIWENDEAKRIAQDLIKKHHHHLEPANIAYLFTDQKMRRLGKSLLGESKQTAGLVKYYSLLDFVILFSHQEWERLDEKGRTAVVDHQLCHCGVKVNQQTGEVSWGILPHDLEEFRAVVERHGLYVDDVKEFALTAAVQLELLQEAE